jgi:glycosyltransferase involved in cell wall biosynthesis
MSKAGLLGRLSAILFSPKSKIVHTYHGLIFDGYFDNRKVRVLKTIERILSKKTNVIIAVGSHTRHTLIQERIAQPQKILVINPGIVTPVKIDIRSRNFATQDKIIVLWVGRLTKIKRPDRLLDIVRIVNRDNLDFTFRVAGNGPELNELQKISELENLPVAYLGTVKDIDFEFQNCDLVISTSDNEGVPISLIQAQFHGKPVVSTNVGSVSDIISHGKNGYLTSLEPEEFVKCMLKFSDNRELLRQMGEDARDRAEISFSLLRFIEKYQEMYLNIK